MLDKYYISGRKDARKIRHSDVKECLEGQKYNTQGHRTPGDNVRKSRSFKPKLFLPLNFRSHLYHSKITTKFQLLASNTTNFRSGVNNQINTDTSV